MPNTITPVGTLVQSTSGASPKTFSITPSTIGNIIGMGILTAPNNPVSTITGGNCTWSKYAGAVNNANIGGSVELWIGVATATGASTATITAPSASTVFAMYQQFSGGGGPWAVDGTQSGTTVSTTSTTSMTFKNLIPSGASRLYLGCGITTTVTITSATSGYTLLKPTSVSGIAMIYNASVSTSQTPVITENSSPYATSAALIIAGSASAATSNLSPHVVSRIAVNRASFF